MNKFSRRSFFAVLCAPAAAPAVVKAPFWEWLRKIFRPRYAGQPCAAQLERVRPHLQELFNESDRISALITKDWRTRSFSRYLYRLPLRHYRGLGKWPAGGEPQCEPVRLNLDFNGKWWNDEQWNGAG